MKTTNETDKATKPLSWVDIVATNGRKSSLGFNGRIPLGHVRVTGNLEHGADVRPCTEIDAVKLCDVITNGQHSALLAVAAAAQDVMDRAKGRTVLGGHNLGKALATLDALRKGDK